MRHCVPTGDGKPGQRRVCSKGCNRLLKVANPETPSDATAERELFSMVVCQADKRVTCEPTKTGESRCTTSATFEAKAVCPFDVDVWNLGATCIANTVHGDKHAQCSDDAGAKKAIEAATKKCRRADDAGEDGLLCQRLGLTY